MNEDEALRFDYGQTTELIRQLVDIRFRLLAIVPTIAATAVAFLSPNPSPRQLFAVGLVGLVATTGIFVYELRNSQIYTAATRRAQYLEQQLRLPSAVAGRQWGGLYSERPARTLRLLGIVPVWHDRALGLVYAAALASWTYLAVWGLLALRHASHPARYGGIAGIAVGVLVLLQVALLDRGDEGPQVGGTNLPATQPRAPGPAPR